MRRFSFRPGIDLRRRKFHGFRGFDGKPFHPPLTDVPIGAYVIAPALDVIAYFFRDRSWATELHSAAGWVFLAGAVVSLATMITGLADWLDTKRGTQIRRMANAHALLMLTMTAVVVLNLVLRFWVEGYFSPSLTFVVLGAAILGLAIIGGTLGGTMVYDFGFNVQTATDNPVYHPHSRDILHPHDKLPDEPVNASR